ncbi:hypothetical protein KH5_11160 [Urechidicola sp. KH5]
MKIKDVPVKEIIPGFFGRFVHLENFTIAFWEVKAGAELPMHQHIHEQSTHIIEGEFEMTCNGETKIWKPGMILTIPSNVEHGGKALTDCKITDVFSPAREDYK